MNFFKKLFVRNKKETTVSKKNNLPLQDEKINSNEKKKEGISLSKPTGKPTMIVMMAYKNRKEAEKLFYRLSGRISKLSGKTKLLNDVIFDLLFTTQGYTIFVTKLFNNTDTNPPLALLGASGIFGEEPPESSAQQSDIDRLMNIMNLNSELIGQIHILDKIDKGPSSEECPVCEGAGRFFFRSPHALLGTNIECRFCNSKGTI